MSVFNSESCPWTTKTLLDNDAERCVEIGPASSPYTSDSSAARVSSSAFSRFDLALSNLSGPFPWVRAETPFAASARAGYDSLQIRLTVLRDLVFHASHSGVSVPPY